MKNIELQDAYARFCDGKLMLGNRCFEREIDLSNVLPHTLKLELKNGGVGGIRLAGRSALPDFAFFDVLSDRHEMQFTLEALYSSADTDEIRVTLVIREALQRMVLRRIFRIRPGRPWLILAHTVSSAVPPPMPWTHRRELHEDFNANSAWSRVFESRCDLLAPAAGIRPLQAVEFFGRTDFCDHPVVVHPLEDEGRFRGNICLFGDSAGNGFFWLQEAPPYMERRDIEEYDFRLENGQACSCGWGIAPLEMEPGTEYRSYTNVLFVHQADERPESLLKTYLRECRPVPAAACRVTVNPWGSCSFHKRLSPDFLREEGKASADCGAELYQIDDGWQRGGTLADICGRNRKLDVWDFWQCSDQLPGGSLAELRKIADECGIKLSLWVAPSSNDDYRDWHDLADIMLGYHGRDDIDCFKLDGVDLRTYRGEHNFESLLETVADESRGEAVFHFDLTWGQRQGYFRFLEYGAIFLENRYACCDSGIGYHPERTWRIVWNLARWHELRRFLIEIPWHGDILESFYTGKGESRPDIYSFEYRMAITFFANPLLWFTPSRVPADERAQIKEMMVLYKQHREAIFAGETEPVGREPDGASISGLWSHDGASGDYLLVLREMNNTVGVADLAVSPGNGWTLLTGNGVLTATGDRVRVTLPSPGDFALWGRR